MAVGIKCTVFLACLNSLTNAECFDSTTYNGTLNVTVGGYTCQRWDSQYPHEHTRTTHNYFPNDYSVYDAHNYCRDAGGTYELWCYTTDKTQRWDYCVGLNETCQVRVGDTVLCRKLSFFEDSTNCPSNTDYYRCRDGHDDDFYVVNIRYHIECFDYNCCRYHLTTTADENSAPTLSPSVTPGETSTSIVNETNLISSEKTPVLSSCKCWTLNCHVYLIFMISMFVYY